ncbi:MAG: hypothetical protein ACM3P1_08915 [Candidatus Saccharibacteria bacterium]
MRTCLILFLAIIAFSCQTNYYLSAPIKSVPAIGLQANLKNNGILIASDAHLHINTAYIEKCLQSLKWYMEATSGIKIKDEILFHKSPDITVLTELKTKYKVDGLLLLTDLDIHTSSFEVPSGRYEYADNRMPEPYLQISKIEIMWTNIDVGVSSDWEYYDFTTGQSYKFNTRNGDILELGEHVPDVDTFIENDPEFFHPVLYKNGTMTASRLIEPSSPSIP